MTSTALHHVTFNTGHCHVHAAPPSFCPHVAAELARFTPGSTTRLSSPFESFVAKIVPGSDHRSGAFSLHYQPEGQTTPLVCIAASYCADPEFDDDMWTHALAFYRKAVAAQAMLPISQGVRRPEVPWLAVMLWPTLGCFEPKSVSWIGDFESCLAHYLINPPHP